VSEANRRRIGRSAAGDLKGDMAEICAETAAYLLEGSIDRMLLFGPVVWLPSDGTSARQWCFIVVGCDRTGETRHDQLNAETESDTLAFRAGVMAALIELRSCVMHDFDDELAMARMAEAAWPGAKVTRLRQQIEAERMSHASP
jgi:hypothetical protein